MNRFPRDQQDTDYASSQSRGFVSGSATLKVLVQNHAHDLISIGNSLV